MDTHIAQRALTHVNEGLRHPVDERFGSDETVIGKQVGPIGQMLAAAKTDLEMQRAIIAEQALSRDRAIGRDRDLGQQLVDQFLLSCAQGLALAATVEPVERGGIACFECRHARADSSLSRATEGPVPSPRRSRSRKHW